MSSELARGEELAEEEEYEERQICEVEQRMRHIEAGLWLGEEDQQADQKDLKHLMDSDTDDDIIEETSASVIGYLPYSLRSLSKQPFKYARGGVVVYERDRRIRLHPSAGVFSGESLKQFFLHPLSNEAPVGCKTVTREIAQHIAETELAGPRKAANAWEKRILDQLPQFSQTRTYEYKEDIYIPNDPEAILLNSRFESGNLRRGVRVADHEYELYLEFDTNCKVYSQWYFFSARGNKGQKVKFHIMNLVKVDSLYNEGMRPCVYSHQKYKRTSQAWHRGGFDVCYKKNRRARQKVKQGRLDEEPELPAKIRALYQLSFSYVFEYDSDVVYFAHFYPYTFNNLQTKIRDHADNNKLKGIMRIDTLCSTLANNPVYCYTITNNIDSYLSSADQAEVLKKSNAARAMLRK